MLQNVFHRKTIKSSEIFDKGIQCLFPFFFQLTRIHVDENVETGLGEFSFEFKRENFCRLCGVYFHAFYLSFFNIRFQLCLLEYIKIGRYGKEYLVCL